MVKNYLYQGRIRRAKKISYFGLKKDGVRKNENTRSRPVRREIETSQFAIA
jgi:hypothetical protein